MIGIAGARSSEQRIDGSAIGSKHLCSALSKSSLGNGLNDTMHLDQVPCPVELRQGQPVQLRSRGPEAPGGRQEFTQAGRVSNARCVLQEKLGGEYQQLLEEGQTDHANAFSITFRNEQTGDQERFMFRYYRNFKYFPASLKVIPLELNYFDKTQNKYIRIADLTWRDRVRVQAFYFTPEGEITMRYYNLDKHQEAERKSVRIPEIVEWFYDDVLANILHLKQ